MGGPEPGAGSPPRWNVAVPFALGHLSGTMTGSRPSCGARHGYYLQHSPDAILAAHRPPWPARGSGWQRPGARTAKAAGRVARRRAARLPV